MGGPGRYLFALMKALRLTVIYTVSEECCEGQGVCVDAMRDRMRSVPESITGGWVPEGCEVFSKVEDITLPDGEAEESEELA
jgi:hypothetical protein